MRVFSKKKAPSGLTRAEALTYIPIKSSQISESRLETGEVIITYPVKLRPYIASLLQRFGGKTQPIQQKKIQLDELGTVVWDFMDGDRSVQQIIRKFAKKYTMHTKEAEVSVTHFIRMLGRRGIIGLR